MQPRTYWNKELFGKNNGVLLVVLKVIMHVCKKKSSQITISNQLLSFWVTMVGDQCSFVVVVF